MSTATIIDHWVPEHERKTVAQTLSAAERQGLAVEALSGQQPITQLAEAHQVSRKFIYAQRDKAQAALDEVFAATGDDQQVLFYLPVTRAWLRQVVLGLILVCHSSYRGVIEFFAALLDQPISLGSVHTIARQGVATARQVQATEELSAIRVGAHDEIFQSHQPILVGCDVGSTYCYLLAQEEHRDATTWGVHLLDLQAKGLVLDHTIADGGKGLRAGQAQACPDWPCWGDHFHLLQELRRLSTYVENRAFSTMAACEKLAQQMHRAKQHAHGHTLSKKLALARQAQQQAIELADELTTLVHWLHHDILAVVGPQLPTRQELYDWVVEALRLREPQLPHRIGPVRRLLENGRDDFLAFAQRLDHHLGQLAIRFQVEPHLVRGLFEVQALPLERPARWQQEGILRGPLGKTFDPLKEAITQLIDTTVRASSVVENLNSRLRNYFFLRKHLGPEYLDLLRFFLNHRRFLRSEHPERVGQSPTQILTGKDHPHWLELLGFERFKQCA
jgi:hypothetical protein